MKPDNNLQFDPELIQNLLNTYVRAGAQNRKLIERQMAELDRDIAILRRFITIIKKKIIVSGDFIDYDSILKSFRQKTIKLFSEGNKKINNMANLK